MEDEARVALEPVCGGPECPKDLDAFRQLEAGYAEHRDRLERYLEAV